MDGGFDRLSQLVKGKLRGWYVDTAWYAAEEMVAEGLKDVKSGDIEGFKKAITSKTKKTFVSSLIEKHL